MPAPTHSGSRPRIGLAASAVLATDRVIGAAGFLGILRSDRSTPGIIFGKPGGEWRQHRVRSRDLATFPPGDCNNRGAFKSLSVQTAGSRPPEANSDETTASAGVAFDPGRAAVFAGRTSPARRI